MDLHWLKPLLGRPAPFTTVYLDVTRADVAGEAEAADRWKAVRRTLEREGAAAAVLDEIGERFAVPTGVKGPHGRVIVADKSDGADETVALIAAAGGTAKAIRMDAGSEPDVIATVDMAVAEYGGLDILFANAGISGGMANIFDTTPELIAEVLRVNLIGPLLAIKHGAPKIAERGKGAIVLTASVAGIRSGAGSPAYSASKAGVINLAAVAAQQLSGSNIRVNPNRRGGAR